MKQFCKEYTTVRFSSRQNMTHDFFSTLPTETKFKCIYTCDIFRCANEIKVNTFKTDSMLESNLNLDIKCEMDFRYVLFCGCVECEACHNEEFVLKNEKEIVV